jgi:hypothetical protein
VGRARPVEALELLAKDGPQPFDAEVDARLVRAGIARSLPRGSQPRVEIRAPIFADLAHPPG